ncbi:hypothetical protein BKA67DRAFT_558516 [Truncatella angustata]|uniref:Uncharacterized protein n=1 Tax=Truncatella angustata TaxID=152316 RepID=A0A9P8UV31_9PEZI|nr:uncharacterized protein BKA67DRAFT_570237 [Truncatella angustata]XP_045962831.1 uncharacterized protein BKA67DRAFT_558516 [Truncatella angustata]KAH6653546.1 hypothetical protein BKA67DRAFT_570237 [Truncatella angustata]KAH6658597.1 hypothetical protein BKA67DRAFT_558516 [Truncatella angustata]
MKFSKASYVFFFCASAVSALTLPHGSRIVARDVENVQDESLAKRVPQEVDFNTLSRREASAEPEAYPEADPEAFSGALSSRDTLSDAMEEIIDYLRDIPTTGPRGIGGPSSWPTGWSDLHGDNKSQYGGRYVCQVRRNGNTYQARVVAHANQGNNIRTGYVFKETDVDECVNRKGQNEAPGYGRAIHFLRKAFGGEDPPAGC